MGDSLTLNVVLGAVVLGILWFMFNTVTETIHTPMDEPILVTVDHSRFQPALINVPAGKPFKLHFVRNDQSSCSQNIHFPQLHLTYQLPLNQKVEITLPAMKRGELDFGCAQGLTRGKIVVS